MPAGTKDPNDASYLQMTLIFWLFGLPCAGKTTLCVALEKKLTQDMGLTKVIHLDGDELRSTLNSDLGFSMEDRAENIRRIASVAGLLAKQKCVVLVSCITPTNQMRQLAKDTVSNIVECDMIMVHCNVSKEVASKRDVKGHYKAAANGTLSNFTGIDHTFEMPSENDVNVTIQTHLMKIDECVDIILDT